MAVASNYLSRFIPVDLQASKTHVSGEPTQKVVAPVVEVVLTAVVEQVVEAMREVEALVEEEAEDLAITLMKSIKSSRPKNVLL